MKDSVLNLYNINNTQQIINNIIEISFNICKSRFELANTIGIISEDALQNFSIADEYFQISEYENGFNHLIKAYTIIDNLLTM